MVRELAGSLGDETGGGDAHHDVRVHTADGSVEECIDLGRRVGVVGDVDRSPEESIAGTGQPPDHVQVDSDSEGLSDRRRDRHGGPRGPAIGAEPGGARPRSRDETAIAARTVAARQDEIRFMVFPFSLWAPGPDLSMKAVRFYLQLPRVQATCRRAWFRIRLWRMASGRKTGVRGGAPGRVPGARFQAVRSTGRLRGRRGPPGADPPRELAQRALVLLGHGGGKIRERERPAALDRIGGRRVCGSERPQDAGVLRRRRRNAATASARRSCRTRCGGRGRGRAGEGSPRPPLAEGERGRSRRAPRWPQPPRSGPAICRRSPASDARTTFSRTNGVVSRTISAFSRSRRFISPSILRSARPKVPPSGTFHLNETEEDGRRLRTAEKERRRGRPRNQRHPRPDVESRRRPQAGPRTPKRIDAGRAARPVKRWNTPEARPRAPGPATSAT